MEQPKIKKNKKILGSRKMMFAFQESGDLAPKHLTWVLILKCSLAVSQVWTYDP